MLEAAPRYAEQHTQDLQRTVWDSVYGFGPGGEADSRGHPAEGRCERYLSSWNPRFRTHYTSRGSAAGSRGPSAMADARDAHALLLRIR